MGDVKALQGQPAGGSEAATIGYLVETETVLEIRAVGDRKDIYR